MKLFKYLIIIPILFNFGCQKAKDVVINQNSIKIIVSLFNNEKISDDVKLINLKIDQKTPEFDYDVLIKRNDNFMTWNSYDKNNNPQLLNWEDNSDATVTAIYKNNVIINNMSDKISTEIPLIQDEVSCKSNDILFYKNTISNSVKKDELNISFKHLLSKISVTVDLNSLNTEEFSLKSISINNIKNNFNWIPTDGDKTIDVQGDKKNTITFKDKNSTYVCLCVPQDIDNNTYLDVTLEDKAGKIYNQSAFFDNITTFESNREYQITNLKIKNPESDKDVIKMNVNVIDWIVEGEYTGSLDENMNVNLNDPKYLTLDMESLLKIKESIKNNDQNALAYYNNIIDQANTEISKQKLYTVATKSITPPSGDKHDFISIAPYWWPNPDTEDGLPYIWKDGQINPEYKEYKDESNLDGITENVLLLSKAYLFSANPIYKERIDKIIYDFFINPDLLMNPNMKYASFRKGISEGDFHGVMTTGTFINLFEGLSIITNYYGQTINNYEGLQSWMKRYMDWLVTSGFGTNEQNTKNNHGTHYDKQYLSLLIFTDQIDEAKKYIEKYTMPRLLQQINEDGSQPEELARTKSWNYTTMNLLCFYQLAMIAEKLNIDLWNYKGDRKESIIKSATDWYIPYLSNQKQWTWKQIVNVSTENIDWILKIAAVKYKDNKYLSAMDNFQPSYIKK